MLLQVVFNPHLQISLYKKLWKGLNRKNTDELIKKHHHANDNDNLASTQDTIVAA